MPIDSITGKLRKNFAWALVGSVLARMLVFISALYFARFLGKSGYGEMGVVQSTAGMLGIFAGTGLGLTATRYVASLKSIDKEKASRIIALIVTMCGCFCLMAASLIAANADYISEHLLNNASLSPAIRASAFLLISNVVFEVVNSLLAGFEDFKSITKGEIVRGLTLFPIAYLLTTRYGLVGAISSLSLSTFLGASILLYKLLIRMKDYSLTFPFSKCYREYKILLRFALPSLLSSSLPIPVMWFATVLLTSIPDGYQELGIMNATNQLRSVVMMVPVILGRVLIPMLSSDHAKGNSKAFDFAMDGGNNSTLILILPASVLFLFLGDKIMSIFGGNFSSGWLVLSGMIAGTAISAIGSVIGSAIVATGFMWFGTLQNVLWAVVYLSITLIGYKKYGANSLAFAFMMAHVVLLFSSLVFLRMRRLIKDQLIKNITLASGVIVGMYFLANQFSSAMRNMLSVPAFAFIVCVCFWISRSRIKTKTVSSE